MPLAFPAPALGWADETDEPYVQSPIDPGLVAFAIDPAILNEENEAAEYAQEPEYQSQHQVQQPSATDQVDDYLRDHDQHSQQDHYARDFPQGLPPEPELLLQIPHDDDEQPPPPRASQKKVRRVKRPRREKDCGFCQGNDERNKEGVPETMLSCFNCGRSGHPTCLDIAGIAETVFNYPWTCIECKACEICHDKGDDTKLLFCDNCDRGWHYDCLDPPLDGPPDGNWNCPLCPPLPEEEYNYEGEYSGEAEASGAEAEDDAAALTESEAVAQVASTPRPKKKKGKTKSKSRPSINYRTPSSVKKTRLPPHGPGRPTGSGNKLSAISPQQRVTFRLRLGSGRSSKGVVEDEKMSPFEGFLSPEEYDASKTVITADDKNRFEKSRIAAENKTLARTVQSSLPEASGSSSTLPPSASLRPLRSLSHLLPPPTPALTESPGPSTPGPAGSNDGTGQLRIRTLRFGEWDIDTWYDAPFPEEYNNLPEGRLWMCEFCLRYMRSGFGWERHQTKCKARHPPGDEIYRDGDISVFEVDGRKNKIYCQNLCLLSKMFLDHKSLFYDVEPFLFYVMTEIDDGGAHFVGYFSKEKRSPKDFNVSCIMTLPVRQRKGWGNLLIDFSYLLSKKEQRVGSPERPLSALGALSYRNYWTLAIMNYLQTAPEHVTFESISAATSMTITDIVTRLREQNMLTADEQPHSPVPRTPTGIKGGKNKHSRTRPRSQLFSNSRRNSSRKVTSSKEENNLEPRIPSPGSYTIQWDRAEVEAYLARWHSKGYLTLKPNRLKWSPYLLTRSGPMLKSDSAPSQVVGADDINSPIPKLFVGGAEPKTASEAGISAVEQVASTGHAEAGPSRASAESPPTSKHSPRATIDVDAENEQDSTFEPEVLEETPMRTRSRSASRQQPTRVSLRQLTSRTGSLTSDARSSIASDRRRTRAQEREHRQNDASLMNGQPSITTDHVESPPTGRQGRRRSLENLRSPRKRSRIASSPESSLLSEPPSSLAHNTSSPPTEDEDDDKTLPLSIASPYAVNENDDGLRRTRSFMSRGNLRPNKRAPARRTSLRLNNGHGDELGNYFTPFFDDPEEALRNAKKARLNQAISLQLSSLSPAALSPVANGVNGVNTNGNAMVVTPVPVHINADLAESDLLDTDAEGEVEDAIGLLPIDPSEEGDMDAEGEAEVEDVEGDADAEGEIEEMELY